MRPGRPERTEEQKPSIDGVIANHVDCRNRLFSHLELLKVSFRPWMQGNSSTMQSGRRRFATKTVVHLLQFAHSRVDDLQHLVNDIQAHVVACYQRSRQTQCLYGTDVTWIVILYVHRNIE